MNSFRIAGRIPVHSIATETAEPVPKYKWRKTWPDPGDRDSWKTDFLGWDGDITVGRIRFEAQGPMKNMWEWSGHGPIHGLTKGRLQPQQGYERTPRLAAAKAEDYYERLMRYNGLNFGQSGNSE